MTTLPHGTWRQALIACTNGYDGIVSAIAFEAGCAGIVENAAPGGTTLTISWDADTVADPIPAIREGIEALTDGSGNVPARLMETVDIPWRDWDSSWREGLTAIESGRRLIVRPSWVPYDNTGDRIEIIIDPRMAFGTGHHATTALCLDALEILDVSGKQVIDAGIGSGVLAIAAVKLGAAEVHGFDHDEWSVDNAIGNGLVNAVGDRIWVDHASLSDWHANPADIVLANMISGALIPNMSRFYTLTAPGGRAVFSGLLAEEEPVFIDAAKLAGFTIDRITRRDEWIAVYTTRPA